MEEIKNLLTEEVGEKHITDIIFGYKKEMEFVEKQKPMFDELKKKNVNKSKSLKYSEYERNNKMVRYYNHKTKKHNTRVGQIKSNDLLVFNLDKARNRYELKVANHDIMFSNMVEYPRYKTIQQFCDDDSYLNMYKKLSGFNL